MTKRDPNAVSPLMGYLPLAVMTAQQMTPGLDTASLLTERALEFLREGQRACSPTLAHVAAIAGLTIANSLKPEAIARITAINGPHMIYPTYNLTMPLFIGSGAEDQDVPPPMHAALIREACAAGTRVEAHLYRGMDHSAAVNRSFADAGAFARRLFAGRPIAPRCAPLPE